MSKRKLLLADDSITIQKVVNLTFADEGIEVISVGDGDSAMQKFDEFLPDLVMVDVNMPGLTGYEICQIIKQNEETRHIPVILLVGSFEPFDEVEANRVGADDFLTKPFQSIRQLVNKVNELLSRGENVSEAPPGSEADPPVDAFANTLAFESKPEISTEFGDAGTDDQMIETSQANDVISEPDLYLQPEATADYAKTQPLSSEDLKGFPIFATDEDAVPESDRSSRETEPETFEDAGAESENETEAVSEPELDYYAPVVEESEISEAETLESVTPEISESETLETETTDPANQTETTDVTDESDAESADESEFKVPEDGEISVAVESETEDPEESDSISAGVETQIPISENLHRLSFEDGDLLELPPPLVEETGIRPQIQRFVSETEAQSEVSEPEVGTVDPLHSFPPELIELIAQKVAERISDKAIRDIARELVPEMTELILKKMAEEKLKE